MPRRSIRKTTRPRVADEIMAGMHELQHMMARGKTPREMFTVKTIDVPEPGMYTPARIRALRDDLAVSQAVFAHLVGVSVILVKSWERGARDPSPLARRLLDTIRANPAQWLASVRHQSVGRAA